MALDAVAEQRVRFVPPPQANPDIAIAVALRVFQAPSFWTIAFTTGALISLACHAWLITAVLAGPAIALLIAFKKTIYSEINLNVHRFYYHCKGYNWWNQMTPRIWMGGMSLHNEWHLEQLRALRIQRVVCISPLYETDYQGIFHSPVTREDWKRAGIELTQIEVENGQPLTFPQFDTALRAIGEGETRVYIHDLVGAGRSASVMEAYLILVTRTAGGQPEAHEFIRNNTTPGHKEPHPQIQMSSAQAEAVTNYVIQKAAGRI